MEKIVINELCDRKFCFSLFLYRVHFIQQNMMKKKIRIPSDLMDTFAGATFPVP